MVKDEFAIAHQRPTIIRITRVDVAIMAFCAAAMVAATAMRVWPIGWWEVLGFITGGVCVWLTVREHLWTWPIGIANNVVFFILFWQSRLYADASLQIVYLVLATYGWWNWLRGGVDRSELTISRATTTEWFLLAAFIPVTTWGLREMLVAAHGAAPFWDALTTAISLAAQFLLCRKRLEHWLLWMLADVIYIPLYFARTLPLTGILYFVFLVMCIVGWFDWQRRLRTSNGREAP